MTYVELAIRSETDSVEDEKVVIKPHQTQTMEQPSQFVECDGYSFAFLVANHGSFENPRSFPSFDMVGR